MIKKIFIILISFIFSGCFLNDQEKENNKSTEKIILTNLDEIPSLPFIEVEKNIHYISDSKLKFFINKHARVEWLAYDSNYFLPSKKNMETIINYLDLLFQKFNISYIPEGTDCDDFARLKTSLSKLIISQAYKVEASPAIFTIFVFQKKPWASIPAGGGHALVAYACVDENGDTKVFIWEPQGTEIVSVLDYPNKDQLFYVGDERTETPNK